MSIIENYNFLLLFFGLIFLTTSVLPKYLGKTFITLPIIYIGLGILIPILWTDIPNIAPLKNGVLIEKVTEITVILSLMAAGLKLSHPLKLSVWRPTLRLLLITMPFCIVAVAFFGRIWLGLSLGSAILLGAVLAPTDPVLAGDIQLNSPGEKKEKGNLRFALTSEAGLNDGLAFPFVYLAGFIATQGLSWNMVGEWFAFEFLYKIIMGIFVGYVCGELISRLIFYKTPNLSSKDSFVALAITFIAYGLAESVSGYGFLAVFVAAYFFRQQELDHEYHRELHDFTGQIEKLLVSGLLISFGIAIVQGLLGYVTWQVVGFGLLFILLIRPFFGRLSLLGLKLPKLEQRAIGFLGVRGIGSFYYLAYALNQFNFDLTEAKILYGVVSFVVISSVIIHGVLTPKILGKVKFIYN